MDEDIGLLVAAYSILMCILRIIEWTGFVPLVYGVDDGDMIRLSLQRRIRTMQVK